jgi:hypothetical protein
MKRYHCEFEASGYSAFALLLQQPPPPSAVQLYMQLRTQQLSEPQQQVSASAQPSGIGASMAMIS